MGYSYAIVGAIRTHDEGADDPHRQALAACAAFRREEARSARNAVGVVGDDPAVEIIMARRGGATAFGVTTGMTSADEWKRQPLERRPHRVVTELRDIIAIVNR